MQLGGTCCTMVVQHMHMRMHVMPNIPCPKYIPLTDAHNHPQSTPSPPATTHQVKHLELAGLQDPKAQSGRRRRLRHAEEHLQHRLLHLWWGWVMGGRKRDRECVVVSMRSILAIAVRQAVKCMVHSVHGWLYAHVLHVWTSNEGVAGTPVGRTTAEANANGVRAPNAVTTVACMPTPCAMCSWRCLGAPSSNVCCRQGAVYACRKLHTVFPSPPAPVGSTGGPPAALSPHTPSLHVSKRHGNGMASGMAWRTKQVLSTASNAAKHE